MAKHDRRGARTGRKRRAPATKPAVAEPRATYPHPLYGDIPLLPIQWTDAAGQVVYTSQQFDPAYEPPLPPGAIRGDVRRQRGRGAFDVPRYFYLDRERSCVQCRDSFVFSAREQKHWYETLGFNFASVAIRCPRCRRQKRSDKAMHHAVDDAKRQLADSPDSAAAQLALAEAIVELRARFDRGNLQQAIAAARKARRLLPPHPAKARALTHYWEARAQAMAGRHDKARAGFEAFLEHAGARSQRREVQLAQAWLDSPEGRRAQPRRAQSDPAVDEDA